MNRLAILVLLVGALTLQAQPANEPPGAFSVSMVGPPEWRFLQEQSVRAELKLSPAQIAAVSLLADWSNFHFAIRCVSLGLIPPSVIRAELPRAREVFIAKTLTNDQRTRLRQIVFQLKEREFGVHTAFAMAARELGLRPDQLEDVSTIKGQRVEAIAKLVTSGDRFDKVKPKVEAANGDTYEKMAEMLTRTQRERLKELRGKGFGGTIAITEPTTKPERPTETKREVYINVRIDGYPAAFFGVYEFELRYLASATVRTEIGITEDQMPSVRQTLDDWNKEFEKLDTKLVDRVAELHEKTAKALDSVLTKKQRERFDQLMAQRRAYVGSREAACGYPVIATALKLTPIQLRNLKDGTKVSQALTKAQSADFEKLMGTKFDFAVVLSVSDPILVRALPVRSNPEALSHEPDGRPVSPAIARYFLIISDRLRLSEEQIKKLRDLAEDEPKFFELIQSELSFADSAPVAGAGRGFTPAGAVADQFRAAVEEQCWKVLDEKQRSLARQIFGRRQ